MYNQNSRFFASTAGPATTAALLIRPTQTTANAVAFLMLSAVVVASSQQLSIKLHVCGCVRDYPRIEAKTFRSSLRMYSQIDN